MYNQSFIADGTRKKIEKRFEIYVQVVVSQWILSLTKSYQRNDEHFELCLI